jgi:hypothetical protein
MKTMLHRLPKIVLILIVLMAVFSPFMQLDSWDRFPVATGDIELHIISVLFETGMFFVLAGILISLFPSFLRFGVQPPAVISSSFSREATPIETDLSCFAVPLRI